MTTMHGALAFAADQLTEIDSPIHPRPIIPSCMESPLSENLTDLRVKHKLDQLSYSHEVSLLFIANGMGICHPWEWIK